MKQKIIIVIQWLLCILISILGFMQTEYSMGTEHIENLDSVYIVLNVCTLIALWLIVYVFINRKWLSNLILITITTGISLSNYYVLEFKGVPLTFLEVKNFMTAMNVVSSYQFEMTELVDQIHNQFEIGLVLCVVVFVLERMQHKKTKLHSKLLMVVLAVSIFYFGYLGDNPIKPKKTAGWLWSATYYEYGYIACSVESFMSLFNAVSIPNGYSAETIEKMDTDPLNFSEETPDIILILNETFYDLSQITELNEDADYLTNYHTMESLYTGYSIVPSSGGGTNSSEYELLTSNSMQLLPGVTPFNILDLTNSNSIVSHLGSLSYDSLASHTGNSRNYYRNRGYPALGFDYVFFYNDFDALDYYQDRIWYETDSSLYKNLIRWYEETMSDSPRLMYLLTIQNHGEWNLNASEGDTVHAATDYGDYDDSVDEFLTCIQLSDLAFKDLTEYYSRVDRPVIICMVGDHSPYFAVDIVDEQISEDEKNLLLRKTPLMIWANYDLGIKNHDLGTMSMNYVVPTLLDMADVTLSPYYQYMLSLKKDVPILTSYGVYYDKNGIMYSYEDETEYTEAVNNYLYLEYNNLTKNRMQELFSVSER